MAKKQMEWQEKMEEFFMKLPALPKNARDVLYKVTPWFALVFGILGVLTGLAGLGLLSVLSPLMVLGAGLGTTGGSFLSLGVAVVASVLMLAAFPGTKSGKMQGWNLLFWSEALSLLGALLSLSIVGGVVGALISYYLLYQIKSYYK